MVNGYQQLWKGIASGTNEAEAVSVLAKVLADEEGRGFISLLERKEAELCIGILDRVSRKLRFPLFAVQMVSPEHHRSQPQTRREKYFPHHVEETC